MSTIYIIKKAGQPVALAEAAGRADAIRLYIESLGVSASAASARDVLVHRALPVLARGAEPAPVDTGADDLFGSAPQDQALEAAEPVALDASAPAGVVQEDSGSGAGDALAGLMSCASDGLVDLKEVAAEQPGELPPVPATSAPAPEGRAHSSHTAPAPAGAHASTESAQSPDAASAAAEPPASTAADELAAARLARLSDAYHAGRDAGRRGDGRYASVVEITDRLCEGMSDEQYDEVREEARRGFDAGAASRAQVLKAPNTRVPVKYRDRATGATWSGRGIKPRWLADALAAGLSLEAFAVDPKA